MNTNKTLRDWIINNPNRKFSAKEVQQELGIYRSTHVSNELGACTGKRASYMKRAGLKLEVVDKGASGSYIYCATPIGGKKVTVPMIGTIAMVPINLSDPNIKTSAIATELARRLNVSS